MGTALADVALTVIFSERENLKHNKRVSRTRRKTVEGRPRKSGLRLSDKRITTLETGRPRDMNAHQKQQRLWFHFHLLQLTSTNRLSSTSLQARMIKWS